MRDKGFTFFSAYPNLTVPAACRATGVEAGIVVIFIAVVALFSIVDNPVATARADAFVRAGVVGNVIAVVTLFVRAPRKAVAALVKHASGEANIFIDLVAVITRFDHRSDFSDNAIATACLFATIEAAIVVHGVAIVAFFDAIVDVAIATMGDRTSVEAAIVVVGISVVAVFVAKPLHAIAAFGFTTIVETSIIVIAIPVITLVAAIQNTVAATRIATVVGTVVIVVFIAIIASLTESAGDTVPTHIFNARGPA